MAPPPTREPAPEPPLRARRLAVALLGLAAADALVYGMVPPVFPAFQVASGLDDAVTVSLAAVFALGAALSLPLRLALLRVVRPSVLLLGGAALAAVGHGLFLPEVPVAALFALRLLQGAASGGIWLGALNTILALKRDGRLQGYGRLLGAVLAVYALGNAVGPLAGLLPRPEAAFPLLGAAHGLAGVLAWATVPRTARSIPALRLGELRQPHVVTGLGSAGVAGVALGLLLAFFPVFFAASLSPREIGLMYAVAAVPIVVLSPLVGARVQRRSSPATMRTASVALLLLVAAIALAPWPAAWLGLLLAAAATFAVVETGGLTLIVSADADPSAYVLATALWGVVYDIAYGIAPTAAGWAEPAVGVPGAVLAVCGVTLAAIAASRLATSLRGARAVADE